MQTLTNMTHNETNTSCPQNRCGEWSKCNNGECEGMHDCTCETPIESWEKEFDETFILGDYNAGTTAKYNNIKSFIRTKLDEAYRKGREDEVEYIEDEVEYIEANSSTCDFDNYDKQLDVLRTTLEEARHAGEAKCCAKCTDGSISGIWCNDERCGCHAGEVSKD